MKITGMESLFSKVSPTKLMLQMFSLNLLKVSQSSLL